MATVVKSVRISDRVAEEVEQLRGERNFNEVVNRALRKWLKAEKRRQEDVVIQRALDSLSPEQVAAEEKIVKLASRSGRRVLRKYGHG